MQLFLNHNELSGEIPGGIGLMSNLLYLNLSTNFFSGYIPESICDLDLDLDYFEIGNTLLGPPYPECIEDFVGQQNTFACS